MSADAGWTGPGARFIALWTDAGEARALFEEGLFGTPLREGAYPALSPRFPGAAWFELLARALNGHTARGADPGQLAVQSLLAGEGEAAWPEAAAAGGQSLHHLATGPVHGDIAEPVHFRFALRGEQVLGLEIRLGYGHRGILRLMRGKSPRLAARFAARIAGDATVAHAIAFAQAAEAALGLAPPPRALALRAVMAELERIAQHAGDLGAIAGQAGFARAQARFGLQREACLAAAAAGFGHRLMMDAVIPGGIAGDFGSGGGPALAGLLDGLEAELPGLARPFREHTGLRDRLAGIGVIPGELAARYAAGGVCGRACGQRVDARLRPGYPPYAGLGVRVPVAMAGDVAARVEIRLAELAESIRLIRALLGSLPEGRIAHAPPSGSGEGLGVAESCRGPVWVWMRLESGMIADLFVADPASLLWPLLARAMPGNRLADFPLVLASLNPAAAAMDL